LARQAPVPLWTPSIGLRHVASLLTVFSFILLAAVYVPRNSVKARARALGVELIRVSRQCTAWPGEDVALGDALAEHLKTRGNTLADFHPFNHSAI
jgi:hypothetical protein